MKNIVTKKYLRIEGSKQNKKPTVEASFIAT